MLAKKNLVTANSKKEPMLLTMPATIDKWDADGHEMGSYLLTPHYGQEEAGDELDSTVLEEF